MGIQFGVLESDNYLLKKILDIIKNVYDENRENIEMISVVHIKNAAQAIDFVKFEFPEFLIVNIDDEKIDTKSLVELINRDPWLHATGIILLLRNPLSHYKGIFDKLNVLSFLNADEIDYQLPKILKIVLTNKQVLVQKDLASIILDKRSGSFVIDNDPSMVTSYINIMTSTLLNEKYINQNKEMGLRIALTELLMNGIEHGNCEISFEEKSTCLDAGEDITKLIAKKNSEPHIGERKVYLDYEFTDEKLKFIIRDCGSGFDHKKQQYNPDDSEDLYRAHGRGIFMTRIYVESLTYNDKGNEATVIVKTDRDGRTVPKGFMDQKELKFKAGELVFDQGERSNNLYYIVKGSYDIEFNGLKVAVLNPSDVFLGEMSFLLNNRRVAAVKARTDGTLIEIPKNAYINIIKKYPNYGLFLSKLLAKRLEKMNEQKAIL